MREVGKVHYTQLTPMQPGSDNEQAWDTYRREVGRLLTEGHEGRWVLIKGDQIIDFFATEKEAMAAGYGQFLSTGFFVQQVREYEPVYFNRHLYDWYSAQQATMSPGSPLRLALDDCVAVLEQMATYQLEPPLNERMLDLGERKEFLGPQEHAELLALVAFSQQRSIEKARSALALQQLRAACPALGSAQ